MKHDFRFIRYFVDDEGTIWSGPHSPADNLHYGKVSERQIVVLSHSDPAANWVEIAPRQAALHLKYKAAGYIVD